MDETVFAATDSGLYKTENYGVLWKRSSSGLNTRFAGNVTAFAVMGEMLYAGSSGSGIYRTSDHGEHGKMQILSR